MFDLSTSLMSSLETSRSRGPHENCITQQKRGGRKITVWTRNWLVRRAKRPWRLATKSSGDIQLSPKATPAHIQQIVFLMSRCSKIQIRENTTSKIKLQFPGLNGFDDGQGDGDRVLPSVRLCYDEEWAVPPWLVLTVELLQKRSQVDRCLHISPHEEALILHVAESCAHRVVLHFSFGGRIKLIWRHRNASFLHRTEDSPQRGDQLSAAMSISEASSRRPAARSPGNFRSPRPKHPSTTKTWIRTQMRFLVCGLCVLKATHRPALQPQHRRPRSGAILDPLRAPVAPPEQVSFCVCTTITNPSRKRIEFGARR